jgi:hypothetical protein
MSYRFREVTPRIIPQSGLPEVLYQHETTRALGFRKQQKTAIREILKVPSQSAVSIP